MKKWKPTCAWIRKAQTAQRRALAAWHPVNGAGEPVWRNPSYGMTAGRQALARVIYLYAAAIGQKRGLLPADLGGWSCWGAPQGNTAVITFGKPAETAQDRPQQVAVMISNLTAWPAPAVAEIEEKQTWQMAA